MKIPRIVHVVGARPNYMKIAPIHAAIAREGRAEQRLIHTGQHYDRELSDVFFDELPLPQADIVLHTGSASHAEQTARALVGLEEAFTKLAPDAVVVAGDVNSTLAGALAAVKLGIPVCHVEAGLRSFDWTMPEEHNRRLTDHVSSLLLTHSASADENLAAEGIVGDRVALVGNTMIDSLLAIVESARARSAWTDFALTPGRYLLVTLHRPALVDSPDLLAATMAALEAISTVLPTIFPVHPRTRDRLAALGFGGGGVRLAPPLPYRDFVSLECEAAGVLTDSGGVQEETTGLGVPCFTLRDNTERPVTVSDGTNTLLGLDPGRIEEIPALIANAPVVTDPPPLWDGHAAERAAAQIERVAGRARS